MDQIDDLLSRGVANIIPGKAELEKLLRSGKTLNVYNGIDPTATRVHIGNAVPLRKLQLLVEMGHNVTFLIGDFTALIGDTSDKEGQRPVLTYEQIEANFRDYKRQAEKVVDFSRVKVVHNSEWLKRLSFEEVVRLTRHFSLNDFISRELIKKRLEAGGSVSLPEVLYPVMQGYDSWYMDTDLQIGGTDQTFNMQAGRKLQKDLRGKESFVLSNVFLEGTDGRKMSKSWGNAIWLDDPVKDLYGKVMSLKDDLIDQYFLLATSLPVNQIPKEGHPMELKKLLAHRIVTELHSPEAADTAQKHFESTVQHGQLPSDIPEVKFDTPPSLVEALVTSRLAKSNSDARRLIDQKGVKLDQETVSNYNLKVPNGSVVSVGSLKHARISF
ncbi:MAG: Tyrosine-tRNA ligase [Candidatus Amesbacteria bacterium GW2011_GWA1_47_16]|uniref:Tyrosine--tRNA ligase n=3 Tax=Candidatus Amesiibacteriota TaxID=1752730 RepID=A0A0G1UUQ3_9BACT|nr:MAG: Tyrosine-tRNA ligase [Candidatus Amesbacteria bacterium GW2011_GWA1_47_16]KKU97912.1 MAG: Tyrosine-tRNA ligase [Candidatus Amesbacteria bacterium GW2011_GWB1_48_13]OGD00218.1 MAG: tyrosine--tRNA ligase [Candidatus Amesbacteria bacterium RIFCSPLOWO2_01_FULL_47_33]OGD00422.1 MAG: tyrosine--tRNA ligase [Candidatus Amesbacteria bacterium RIFCSPHIGHO2_01_FULL_47_34]